MENDLQSVLSPYNPLKVHVGEAVRLADFSRFADVTVGQPVDGAERRAIEDYHCRFNVRVPELFLPPTIKVPELS